MGCVCVKPKKTREEIFDKSLYASERRLNPAQQKRAHQRFYRLDPDHSTKSRNSEVDVCRDEFQRESKLLQVAIHQEFSQLHQTLLQRASLELFGPTIPTPFVGQLFEKLLDFLKQEDVLPNSPPSLIDHLWKIVIHMLKNIPNSVRKFLQNLLEELEDKLITD